MMVYGAVLKKGERYYSYLGKVFAAIGNAQRNYNWLISYPDCFPATPEFGALLAREHCWLTGEELTEMIRQEDFQWVWGVLSGFAKDISWEKVMEYPVPDADSPGFWRYPLVLEHPLASLEIAAFDSSMTLLVSREKKHVDGFRTFFSLSGDLAEENEACQKKCVKGGTHYAD